MMQVTLKFSVLLALLFVVEPTSARQTHHHLGEPPRARRGGAAVLGVLGDDPEDRLDGVDPPSFFQYVATSDGVGQAHGRHVGPRYRRGHSRVEVSGGGYRLGSRFGRRDGARVRAAWVKKPEIQPNEPISKMRTMTISILETISISGPTSDADADRNVDELQDNDALSLAQSAKELLEQEAEEDKPQKQHLNKGHRAVEIATDGGANPVSVMMSSSLAVTITYFIVSSALSTVRTWNQLKQHTFRPVEQLLESTMSAMGFAPMLCVVFFAVTKRASRIAHGEASDTGTPIFVLVAVAMSATAFCAHAFFWFCGECVSVKESTLCPLPAPSRRRRQGEHLVTEQPVAPRSDSSVAGTRLYVWLSHACVGVMHWSVVIIFIGLSFMRDGQVEVFTMGPYCTLLLALPYFLVHLVLHISQSASVEMQGVAAQVENQEDAAGNGISAVPLSLYIGHAATLGTTAMSLAPMLCVLFLSAQPSEPYDEDARVRPVEVSMCVCTVAVVAQLLLALLAPFLAGAELRRSGAEKELEFVTKNHKVFRLIGFLRTIVMTTLYICVEVICGSLFGMHDLQPLTRLLRHLMGSYFLVYVVFWALLSIRDATGYTFSHTLQVLRVAKDVLSFCPMLALLFLEAWTRAQHLTTPSGEPGVPQAYAQDMTYIGTVAFLVQLLVILMSGVLLPTPVGARSHRTLSQKRDALVYVLLALFQLATLVLFVCIAGVVVSVMALSPETAVDSGAWMTY